VDIEKCEFLGICHDFIEVVVGDIPTYMGIPKEYKYKKEDFGIQYTKTLLKYFNLILGAKIRAAWEEYEAGVMPEAR
ncbi:hypothetical protein BGZ57DRAFT_759142, partial [Hyaloscypha finlandica]